MSSNKSALTADVDNQEYTYESWEVELVARIRKMKIDTLLDKRKRRFDFYFDNECKSRSLVGGPKIMFWCHYTAWVDAHASKTNEDHYDFLCKNRNSIAIVIDSDRKAWEEFLSLEFKEQPPLPPPSTSTSTNKPAVISKVTKSTSSPLRKGSGETQNTPNFTLKSRISKDNAAASSRKSGWEKGSECTLLKRVLLSNARRVSMECGVQIQFRGYDTTASLGKSLLEKETQLIYSTGKVQA
ncbi:hypothetical protein FB446DRAFT_849809 [Lentinula raphanica]|nr:hypothetical protein FB446DRAFT_849809 [Lentinula raphanica]